VPDGRRDQVTGEPTLRGEGRKQASHGVWPAALGRHRLDAMLDLGIVQRRRTWDVDVPTEGCAVTICYSRLWGNLSKKLDLRPA
jgi:hypothetical protein